MDRKEYMKNYRKDYWPSYYKNHSDEVNDYRLKEDTDD